MDLTTVLAVVFTGCVVSGGIAYARTGRAVYVACFAVIRALIPVLGIVLASVWPRPGSQNRPRPLP